MPFWFLIVAGFSGFVWWTNQLKSGALGNDVPGNDVPGSDIPGRGAPGSGWRATRNAGAHDAGPGHRFAQNAFSPGHPFHRAASGWKANGLSGKALLLALMWRMGPGRSIALLSSLTAAWPMLQQLLQWRGTDAPQARAGNATRLTRAEAAHMLDLHESASREEVEAAYRRLMARVHPDTGGNAYLAQLINAARERMLS